MELLLSAQPASHCVARTRRLIPSMPSNLDIQTFDAPVLRPQPGVDWADTMLLNPALIDDPSSRRLHMLFRATGPWPRARRPRQPLPYPIFLGYAFSDDSGRTWTADFSRPALAPRLAQSLEDMHIVARDGSTVLDHANGCIEDPRLFRLDDHLYLTTACRVFPPGPYWEKDDPMQCAPGWARSDATGLGRAFTENLTVTTLWEVDLAQLSSHRYESAFRYVTHLTDLQRGDNRDVFPFPCRMRIGGRERYVCLHRPMQPAAFGAAFGGLPPSIFIAVADRLEDFAGDRAEHRLLARGEFDWESNRIGASWVPVDLGRGEWLLPYHGKDPAAGYTQSFMILREGEDGWPVVAHRCSERLMYARRGWELQGLFKTPCVFTCGGLLRDGRLIMSYGAADSVAGIAETDFAALVECVRRFDPHGRPSVGGASA